jgi:hypothetical protein
MRGRAQERSGGCVRARPCTEGERRGCAREHTTHSSALSSSRSAASVSASHVLASCGCTPAVHARRTPDGSALVRCAACTLRTSASARWLLATLVPVTSTRETPVRLQRASCCSSAPSLLSFTRLAPMSTSSHTVPFSSRTAHAERVSASSASRCRLAARLASASASASLYVESRERRECGAHAQRQLMSSLHARCCRGHCLWTLSLRTLLCPGRSLGQHLGRELNTLVGLICRCGGAHHFGYHACAHSGYGTEFFDCGFGAHHRREQADRPPHRRRSSGPGPRPLFGRCEHPN